MRDGTHIVVADDDAARRAETVRALGRAGWRTLDVGAAPDCLAVLARERAAAVLVDLPLADLLLAPLAAAHADVPILVSGPDCVDVAVAAMRRGAWDYLVRRPDLRHLDALRDAIARAADRRLRIPARVELETLASALRGASDGVAVVDGGGRVVFANRALAAALGHQPPALVGRRLADLVQAPGTDVRDVLDAVAQQGSWTGELHARSPAGAVWEATLTPMAAGSAEGAGVPAAVGILRDVREQREREQFRADFLSTVTHDIKSPLTVILGYTELLGDGAPPSGEVLAETLFRIRESGEQIHALVSNFLELSRIEAGQYLVDRRATALGELVDRVVAQYRGRARRKGVTLTLERGAVPTILGDPPQIERMIVNVLGNAIKYTPSGGRIAVALEVRPEHVAVVVADTGPGIPAEEMPHVFEKYRRARGARRVEGTGLGLFIAKTVATAHGGDILVESAPGVGSTFTIVLPRVPA
jgi:PAS domain S-box-containing protein